MASSVISIRISLSTTLIYIPHKSLQAIFEEYSPSHQRSQVSDIYKSLLVFQQTHDSRNV